MRKRKNKNTDIYEFIDDLDLFNYYEKDKYSKLKKMLDKISDYCKIETNGGRVAYVDDELTLMLYTHNSQQANRWCDTMEVLGYKPYQVYSCDSPIIAIII